MTLVHIINTDQAQNLGVWFGKSVKSVHLIPRVDAKNIRWAATQEGEFDQMGRSGFKMTYSAKGFELKSGDSSHR